MSRPLRIEYPGAWYHVMNRGLERRDIFLCDAHREAFLKLLSEICRRYRVEIHAYCLMRNHYHLLIRTPLGNISRAMRHLNGVYTQRFNVVEKRDGALFRGRFKAILVEADIYLLRLSRYIHLNPVVAKVVKKAEHYRWSSYSAYISGQSPEWLVRDVLKKYFGKRLFSIKYKLFVEEGVDEEVGSYYKKLKRVSILGSEAFTKTVAEKYLKEQHRIRDIPEHRRLLSLPSIEEIITAVSNYYSVQKSEIHIVKKRYRNTPRAMVMYIARELGQHSLCDIAKAITNTSGSGVSQMVRRIDAEINKNRQLKKDVAQITLILQLQ